MFRALWDGRGWPCRVARERHDGENPLSGASDESVGIIALPPIVSHQKKKKED